MTREQFMIIELEKRGTALEKLVLKKAVKK